MPWKEMRLRDATVLARCDARGELVSEGGRVEIRYKPKDGRSYRAGARNLSALPDGRVFPDEHCAPAEAAPPSGKGAAKGAAKGGAKKPKASSAGPPAHEDGAIIVYADGACSGNPGPAGSGVVILDGERRFELSEFLGTGTNNIAELTAILRAAERLAGREEPIRMYTDSKYSIGVLTQGWKAKKNPELIKSIKAALGEIEDLMIYYVKGHAGIELNERADELARIAVEARRSSGWITV